MAACSGGFSPKTLARINRVAEVTGQRPEVLAATGEEYIADFLEQVLQPRMLKAKLGIGQDWRALLAEDEAAPLPSVGRRTAADAA